MLGKKLIAAVLMSSLLLTVFGVKPVFASAPYTPELVSPANGSTADSNPPRLCARNNGDPEGNEVYIRFESWGGGEGDHHSEWINAGSTGNVVCWQDTGKWSEGNHSWAARAMDSNNEQSGASPDWSVKVPPSSPQEAVCTIEPLTTSPKAPQPVGTVVSIYAAATCTNGVAALRFKLNGGVLDTINGSSGTIYWNTAGYSESEYTITVEVADNVAGYIKSRSQGYTLSSVTPPQPPPGPSISEFSFTPSSEANIGDQVSIHIRVGSSNPGAIRIFVPCGEVKPFEATVQEYDASWTTNTCGAGTYNVKVCARDKMDNDWANPTCATKSYTLSSTATSDAPTLTFWTDSETIQPGQCTYIHWTTTNAEVVELDGVVVATSGDKQVCPPVTTHYSLKAKNQSGERTASLSIVVSKEIVTVVPDGPHSTPQPVPSGNQWQVGARVGLCKGATIRTGSGFQYDKNIFVVPEDNWQVDIIDGPRKEDGVTWWDVSRKNIDGGGTGWVYYEQAGGCESKSENPDDPPNQENQLTIGDVHGDGFDISVEDPWYINLLKTLKILPATVVGAEVPPCYASFKDSSQCVAYVALERPDSCYWLPSSGRDAYRWDDYAMENGYGYGVYVDTDVKTSTFKEGQIQQGDIVVFNQGCGIPDIPNGECNFQKYKESEWNPTYAECGHVGIVESYSIHEDKITILVSERNVNFDGKDSTNTHIVLPCMGFIHEPKEPNLDSPEKDPSGQLDPAASENPSEPNLWDQFWEWIIFWN